MEKRELIRKEILYYIEKTAEPILENWQYCLEQMR